jgi:hypothetical protein
MPSSALFCMVITSELFLALWATKLGTNWVLEPHLDLVVLHDGFDLGDDPRGCQS